MVLKHKQVIIDKFKSGLLNQIIHLENIITNNFHVNGYSNAVGQVFIKPDILEEIRGAANNNAKVINVINSVIDNTSFNNEVKTELIPYFKELLRYYYLLYFIYNDTDEDFGGSNYNLYLLSQIAEKSTFNQDETADLMIIALEHAFPRKTSIGEMARTVNLLLKRHVAIETIKNVLQKYYATLENTIPSETFQSAILKMYTNECLFYLEDLKILETIFGRDARKSCHIDISKDNLEQLDRTRTDIRDKINVGETITKGEYKQFGLLISSCINLLDNFMYDQNNYNFLTPDILGYLLEKYPGVISNKEKKVVTSDLKKNKIVVGNIEDNALEEELVEGISEILDKSLETTGKPLKEVITEMEIDALTLAGFPILDSWHINTIYIADIKTFFDFEKMCVKYGTKDIPNTIELKRKLQHIFRNEKDILGFMEIIYEHNREELKGYFDTYYDFYHKKVLRFVLNPQEFKEKLETIYDVVEDKDSIKKIMQRIYDYNKKELSEYYDFDNARVLKFVENPEEYKTKLASIIDNQDKINQIMEQIFIYNMLAKMRETDLEKMSIADQKKFMLEKAELITETNYDNLNEEEKIELSEVQELLANLKEEENVLTEVVSVQKDSLKEVLTKDAIKERIKKYKQKPNEENYKKLEEAVKVFEIIIEKEEDKNKKMHLIYLTDEASECLIEKDLHEEEYIRKNRNINAETNYLLKKLESKKGLYKPVNDEDGTYYINTSNVAVYYQKGDDDTLIIIKIAPFNYYDYFDTGIDEHQALKKRMAEPGVRERISTIKEQLQKSKEEVIEDNEIYERNITITLGPKKQKKLILKQLPTKQIS